MTANTITFKRMLFQPPVYPWAIFSSPAQSYDDRYARQSQSCGFKLTTFDDDCPQLSSAHLNSSNVNVLPSGWNGCVCSGAVLVAMFPTPNSHVLADNRNSENVEQIKLPTWRCEAY